MNYSVEVALRKARLVVDRLLLGKHVWFIGCSSLRRKNSPRIADDNVC